MQKPEVALGTEVPVKANKTKTVGNNSARKHILHETEGAAAGMALGAVVGAAAGAPGAVAGALIGAVTGALTAAGLDRGAERQAEHTRELDEEIGVMGGDLGAPNLKHPPSTVRAGICSAASAGADTSGGGQPAEGPMQSPDD